MTVYFTGTGNSRYCAQMLADKLGDELVDAFHFIRNGIAADFIFGRPWVFVAPTTVGSCPERAEACEIVTAAHPVLESGIACIREGRDFPAHKAGIVGKLKSGIVNHMLYRFFIKARPFTVSDGCISCGRCENACPLGNIQMKSGKPVWGDRCTHFMA